MGTPPSTARTRNVNRESLPSQIVAILAKMPVPMALLDVPGFRVQAANAPLLELTQMEADELIGLTTLDFVPPEHRATVRADLEALAEGHLDGFQTGRVFHVPNGTVVRATAWARRVVVDGRPWCLAVILPDPDDGVTARAGYAGASVDMMMAMTDHEWVIEHVSADAERVLGVGAEDVLGQAVLGTVHPGDAADFILSVAEAVSSKRSVACSARLRGGAREWREVTCFITSLCSHSPPRLGLAVSRPDGARPRRPVPPLVSEEALWRIVLELRAAGLTTDAPTTIAHAPPRRAAQLSGRQWEIVERFAKGQNARQIAAGMYLSPSTVRNHLVAIYRKFGVHSQAQLMAALRDEALPWRS